MEISSGSDNGDDGKDEDLDDDDDDSEGGSLLDPIWDQSDDVFRCTVCTWEVTDGICSACMMEFKWNEVPLTCCLLGYSQTESSLRPIG